LELQNYENRVDHAVSGRYIGHILASFRVVCGRRFLRSTPFNADPVDGITSTVLLKEELTIQRLFLLTVGSDVLLSLTKRDPIFTSGTLFGSSSRETNRHYLDLHLPECPYIDGNDSLLSGF
jgi:hypothetical protein